MQCRYGQFFFSSNIVITSPPKICCRSLIKTARFDHCWVIGLSVYYMMLVLRLGCVEIYVLQQIVQFSSIYSSDLNGSPTGLISVRESCGNCGLTCNKINRNAMTSADLSPDINNGSATTKDQEQKLNCHWFQYAVALSGILHIYVDKLNYLICD